MAKLKYGVNWKDCASDLHIELTAFREGTEKFGGQQNRREAHFKNIVRTFWGHKSRKPFQWNPWNERMLEEACRNKYMMLSGSASCGKSYFMAMWGIVNWLADPLNTIVLFTSTGLKESRKRIWGDVEEFFSAATDAKGNLLLPGKLVSSQGQVRTEGDGMRGSDKCGLHLIPGDRAKEKENVGKLIGIHTKRVFFMADELPELSPALLSAAKGNLATANTFQMIGSGNFKSVYDPFGEMCEPIGGWSTVTTDFDEWETKDGICLRFDGLRSPNILLGREHYLGIYSAKDLESHRSSFPETSPEFWRMCRSFPCQEADTNRIYSESDMLKGDVKNSSCIWKSNPTKWASLDPAFANGGDKAVATFGMLGETIEGKTVMLVTKQAEIFSDVRQKIENRSTQVAKEFIRLSRNENIESRNTAYDASGGGIVFGDLLFELWKESKCLGVQFGGAPSERPVKVGSSTFKAKEVYALRVGELWFSGLTFVHSGQVKGLTNPICCELVERRRKESEKSNGTLKRKIESKAEMKLRTKNLSPDHADSWLIGLELCRERLGFTAIGMEGTRAKLSHNIQNRRMLVNRIFANSHYQPEQMAA